MIKRFMKLFVATTVVLSILLGIVPDGIYAASAKSGVTIKVKSKTKKVKKIKKSKDGKISILDGPMPGPGPKEVGKPKPLKFKIDFDNYDLKFTDVPKDHPYYKGIVWAVENGIIKNEEREFKPDETIKMREFLMAFFNMREKYHQYPDDYVGAYRYFLEIGRFRDKYVITTDLPEARALAAMGCLQSVYFIPHNTDKDGDLGGFTYSSNKKITNVILYYAIGIAKFDYIAWHVDNTDGMAASSSIEYIDKIISDNLVQYATYIASGNTKLGKQYAKYLRKNSIWENNDQIIRMGIDLMQYIALLKLDPTFKELELGKEVSRGKLFETLYRLCLCISRNYKKDYRIIKGG